MRILDILIASALLLLLLPVMTVIAIILKFTGEGEILYVQERVGEGGKLFGIIKFATMLKNSPFMGAGTITAKNDQRILPVGRFLRKSKLNELPQLLNILKGDMSLVGPRPHVVTDLNGIAADRLALMLGQRPGLTGIASIMFRNEEMILQRFENPRLIYDSMLAPYKAELEIWYLENKSLKMYTYMVFLTVLTLFHHDPCFILKICATSPRPSDDLMQLMLEHG